MLSDVCFWIQDDTVHESVKMNFLSYVYDDEMLWNVPRVDHGCYTSPKLSPQVDENCKIDTHMAWFMKFADTCL